MPRPLAVDGLGRAVGVLLHQHILLLDPVVKLLAVLQELVEQQLVLQLLQLGQGQLVVDVPPLGDVVGLLGDLVGGEVLLGAESLGELQHTVDLVVVGLHGGEEGLVLLDEALGLLQVARRLVLGEQVLLLAEQHLGLLGVAVEHLQVEALAEQLLPVLPHLVDLGPAVLERVEALAEEHVLRVVEGGRVGRHLLAVLHHGGVVVGVAVDLLADLLVLAEQLLGLGQRRRRVLVGDRRLRLGQPRLQRNIPISQGLFRN